MLGSLHECHRRKGILQVLRLGSQVILLCNLIGNSHTKCIPWAIYLGSVALPRPLSGTLAFRARSLRVGWWCDGKGGGMCALKALFLPYQIELQFQ